MRIIITEKQLKRLIEGENNGAPTLNGGDLVTYPGSQVSTTANITRPDGEEEYGLPMITGSDRIAKKRSKDYSYKAGYSRG